MNRDDAPFEIHVHGDVKLRTDVGFDALQDALKPLWKYAGARSLADGAASLYEDEPGIRFDPQRHLLQMCWTLHGEDDFRHQLDDLCMNLNELSAAGSQIEVTFYDADYDEDDEDDGREARDDFVLLFVGPTPEAIMQAQRDLLVEDVGRLVQKMWVGGLTIRPVHLTGKCGLQTHGCIKNNGLATMPLSSLTIKYTSK